MSSEDSNDRDRDPFIIERPERIKDDDLDGSESSSEDGDDGDDENVSVKAKFEEILTGVKKETFDLRNSSRLREFSAKYDNYIGQTTGYGDSLLHLLVEDAKDKVFAKYEPLVELLIKKHPKYLRAKDSNEKTPLYIAIHKKRDKLVRFICINTPNIDEILRIPCSNAENCLHVAMRRRPASKIARILIGCASEETLLAKDSKGHKTPLHLAVEYERCTDAQLDVVQDLVARCDKAIDERTDDSLSPYRYHERTRADAKKKEREATQGKKDEGRGQSGRDGATKAMESANLKSKAASHVKDSKSSVENKVSKTKRPGDAPFAADMPPQTPLERSHAPHDRLGGGLGGGGYPNNRVESDAGDVPKMGITRQATYAFKREPRKVTEMPDDSKKKKSKGESKVTEESASAIRSYLKLHCMRTRDEDNTVDFLYGRNQENQIYFDLLDNPSKMSQERIEEGLAHVKFEDVLQYVAVPYMQIQKPTPSSKFSKKNSKRDGEGRSDMIFLFNFLRKKGVQRVLRVIVDDYDRDSPAHSDEAIELALGGLKVEVWEWRKIDMCTETIFTAAPDVTEVRLYWSGNNAVLHGWGESGGLNVLKKLKKVNLHILEGGLDSARRTNKNVKDFTSRLTRLRDDVEVEVVDDRQPERHDSSSGPTETTREQSETPHRWLTCMDTFADFIQNVDPPLPMPEPVTIAVIDDGIDINEQSLHYKIIGGRSFCHRDQLQNLRKPYYVTSGGHGTIMASLICRVFPRAQLHVLRLDEYIGDQAKRQITAKSAAKAVQAAVDKQVHIISMSWTIERTDSNAADIAELESAVDTAAKAGILMFCAAKDDGGMLRDDSFPAACRTKGLFKIGAAKATGAAWDWVSDPTAVDFFFPGYDVLKERPNETSLESLRQCRYLTGSSVATALAAGLAGLVLHCIQLVALHTQTQDPRHVQRSSTVTMEDFKAIKGYKRMGEAFLAIGTSPATMNKYLEVWDVFEPAAKKADAVERERRIEIVAEVAVRLKMRKTLQ